MGIKRIVMIAEDEAMTALYIKMMLEKSGYDVMIYSSGEKIIEAVDNTLPDLVILDIHLAGDIDGIETAIRIRKKHPVPVIFATGYQEDSYNRITDAITPLACVTKPIDMAKVLSVMSDYFKERQS